MYVNKVYTIILYYIFIYIFIYDYVCGVIMVSVFTKRVVAYIADFFVVSAIMWIIAGISYLLIFPFLAYFVYDYFLFLLLIVQIIYFVVLESKKGTTVGKHLLFLKVVSIANYNYRENIDYRQAIIRNLSKIYWIPIIFDIIIGRFYGSSNERILGRLSMSDVISEDSDPSYKSKSSLEEYFREKQKI